MEKMKLKDGSIINIMFGSDGNKYRTPIEDMVEFNTIYGLLTEDNLTKIEIIDENDLVVLVDTDRALSKIYPATIDGVLVAVIEFGKADVVSRSINNLLKAQKELEITQKVQNEAIMDLAMLNMQGGL